MREAPLFTLLTMPKLLLRVPRAWLAITATVALTVAEFGIIMEHAFIGISAALLVGFIVWLVGFILARYWDEAFIDIFLVKHTRIKPTKSAFPHLYKGNRYIS